MPFTKEDVVTHFLEHHPLFKKTVEKVTIIENDLPHLRVKFKSGVRSGNLRGLRELLPKRKVG